MYGFILNKIELYETIQIEFNTNLIILINQAFASTMLDFS